MMYDRDFCRKYDIVFAKVVTGIYNVYRGKYPQREKLGVCLKLPGMDLWSFVPYDSKEPIARASTRVEALTAAVDLNDSDNSLALDPVRRDLLISWLQVNYPQLVLSFTKEVSGNE